MICRRPFGLATIGILLVILYTQARFKSRPRAVVRGHAQVSLLVLLPDHADHAAGLHSMIIQGVLSPPSLPGSAHHDQQRRPRPDEVIVVYSDSGALCTAQASSGALCNAQASVALNRLFDAMSCSVALVGLVSIFMLLVPATARTSKSRNTPVPQVGGGLVRGLLLTLARTGSAFTTKSSLVNALGEWCTNAANAATTHGHISTWDVSVITDFSLLVGNSPCRPTFNENLNAWDVGRATTLKVRPPRVS